MKILVYSREDWDHKYSSKANKGFLDFQESVVYVPANNSRETAKNNTRTRTRTLKDSLSRELTVVEIKEILKRIDPKHWCYFLGNSKAPSPLGMLVETIPVPPLCIRPTVKITEEKNNEDDLTIKLFEMLKQKSFISIFLFC